MKKKIFMLAMAACLIVLSIAGSSLAYFTDTDEKTTVFTAGNVEIELSFPAPTPTRNAYPNQKITAPASIKNTGSENAFVGAIITFTAADGNDLRRIFSNDGSVYTEGKNTEDEVNYNTVIISNLLTELVASSDYTVEYTAIPGAGEKITSYKVYVLKKTEIANNATVTLFEGVTIPAKWDNKEMAVFNGLEISVKAYATQTVGFTNDAVTALTTAFAVDWSGFPVPNN